MNMSDLWAIQVLRKAMGDGWVLALRKKTLRRFNVISVTRGLVKISRKKGYVTLEWPLMILFCMWQSFVFMVSPLAAFVSTTQEN